MVDNRDNSTSGSLRNNQPPFNEESFDPDGVDLAGRKGRHVIGQRLLAGLRNEVRSIGQPLFATTHDLKSLNTAECELDEFFVSGR